VAPFLGGAGDQLELGPLHLGCDLVALKRALKAALGTGYDRKQWNGAANYLEAGGHLHKREPYRTLGSLDRQWIALAGSAFTRTPPLVSWPSGLSDL
jgi:hypothetical protein